MSNIIVIAILLMPWVFIPDPTILDQMRLPKAVFFDVVCMAIITSAFIGGLKFTYRNKWFGILFAITMFSFFMNWYVPFTMSYDGKRVLNVWNIMTSIHVVLGMVASYFAMSNLDRSGYIRIAKAICLSSVFVSCFGILQAIGFDPMAQIAQYKSWEPNRVAALLDHPNMLGNFLALSIPFFLFFSEPIYAVGIGIVCLCLYLTHSSTSIMAFFISTLAYFMVKNIRSVKWITAIFVSFVLILLVVMTVPTFNKMKAGFTGRTGAWKYAIAHIKENPVFGLGTGKFVTYGYNSGSTADKDHTRWEFVHNDYLEMTLGLGFVGLVMFGFLIFNTYGNFNLSKDNTIGFSYIAAMTAFLILMFGSFPMEFPPCALLGMISFWGSERL